MPPLHVFCCVFVFFRPLTTRSKASLEYPGAKLALKLLDVKIILHETTGPSNLTLIPSTSSTRSHHENKSLQKANIQLIIIQNHSSQKRCLYFIKIRYLHRQWYGWSQQSHSETNNSQQDQRHYKGTGVNTEGINGLRNVPDLKEE